MAEMKRPANMTLIRSLYERWERLETERRNLSEDLKELFKEAKGDGFNSKALRFAFADKFQADNEPEGKREKREADEADADLYLAALTGPSHACEASQSYAEAKGNAGSSNGRTADFESVNAGSIPAPATINPETGELTDNQESEPAHAVRSDGTASVAGTVLPGPSEPAESSSDEISAPHNPVPHTPQVDGGRPNPSSDAMPSGQGRQRAEHVSGKSEHQSASEAQAGNSVGSASGASATHSKADDFDIGDVPAFLRRTDGYPKCETEVQA